MSIWFESFTLQHCFVNAVESLCYGKIGLDLVQIQIVHVIVTFWSDVLLGIFVLFLWPGLSY